MALNSLANLQQDFNQLRSNYSLNAFNRQGSSSAQRFQRGEMTRSAYIGGGTEPPTVASATVSPATVEMAGPSVPAGTMDMNTNSNVVGARPFGQAAAGFKGEFPSLEAAVENQFAKGLVGYGKTKAFDVAMTGKQLADAGLSLTEVAKLSPEIAGSLIANPKTFGGVMTKALDTAFQAAPARDLARSVRTEMTRMGNPAADVERATNQVAYQQFQDEMAFGGTKEHILAKLGVIDPQLSTQLAAAYTAPEDLAAAADVDPNAVSGYFSGTVPSAADVEAGKLAEAVSNAPAAEEAQAYNLGLAGFTNARPMGMSIAALGGEGGNAGSNVDVNQLGTPEGWGNAWGGSGPAPSGGGSIWDTPSSGYGSPNYGGGAGRQGGYGGTSGGWA